MSILNFEQSNLRAAREPALMAAIFDDYDSVISAEADACHKKAAAIYPDIKSEWDGYFALPESQRTFTIEEMREVMKTNAAAQGLSRIYVEDLCRVAQIDAEQKLDQPSYQ